MIPLVLPPILLGPLSVHGTKLSPPPPSIKACSRSPCLICSNFSRKIIEPFFGWHQYCFREPFYIFFQDDEQISPPVLLFPRQWDFSGKKLFYVFCRNNRKEKWFTSRLAIYSIKIDRISATQTETLNQIINWNNSILSKYRIYLQLNLVYIFLIDLT